MNAKAPVLTGADLLKRSSRDRTRTYNLPVNSRTLCQLSYAGLACAGANGLEGAAVPADWCRGDKGSAPARALMRRRGADPTATHGVAGLPAKGCRRRE